MGANAAFRHDSAVERGIPAVLCSGTNRRTGQPCRNYAMVGTTVCRKHGGQSPFVRARIDVDITLARLMARDPRPASAILADVLSDADAAYLYSRIPLLDDEHAPTSDEMLRHQQAMDRVVTYVRTIIATKSWDIYIAKQQATLVQEAKVIVRVLEAGLNALDLTLDEDRAATLKSAIAEALSRESGNKRDPYYTPPEPDTDRPALEAAPVDVVPAEVIDTEPVTTEREPVTEVDHLAAFRAADAWVKVLT